MLRKTKSILSLVLIALLVLGAVQMTALAAPATKVAIVGDDVTYGVGLTDPDFESYANLLVDKLGDNYEVENFAVNDATILKTGMAPTDVETKTLAAAYSNSQKFEESLEFQPDVVVIALGINDAKTINIAKIDQLQQDLENMIDKYQRLKSRPRIMIATPLKVSEEGPFGITQANVDQVVTAIKAAADNMKCFMVDLQTFSKDVASNYIDSDPIHLNSAGHEKLADFFAKKIDSSDFKNLPTRKLDIEVRLNDEILSFGDVAPQIIDGRTLVPVRAVFEALGATVDWDGATGTATGTRNGTVVKLVMGSTEATINDTPQTLDVPPQIINDRSLLPIRFVAEAFGAEVDWNADGQMGLISTNVALGKEVETDNVQGGNTNGETILAEFVNDGKLYTRWSTDFSDPHYITVNLGEVKNISKVTIFWEASYATGYTIQVSDDNATWKDIYTTTEGKGEYEEISFDPVNAQYVKINCTARNSEYGFSIYELGVHI